MNVDDDIRQLAARLGIPPATLAARMTAARVRLEPCTPEEAELMRQAAFDLKFDAIVKTVE